MSKTARFLLILIMVVLSACQPSAEIEVAESITPTHTLSPSPSATVSPTSVPPTQTPTATHTSQPPTPTLRVLAGDQLGPGFNPLTGLPVDDPDKLDRRPVMVKISNWPRSGRPHAGLTSADIVFEYFIGFQMNRFLAVYYGDDAEEIGPVRSGRLVDAQLVNFYQGILGYGDADPVVDNVILGALGDRAFGFLDTPCPAMCGEGTHDATGVFANSAALIDYAERQGVDMQRPNLAGMYFSDDPPPADEDGSILHVEYADFSVMQWRYDRSTEQYNLWMEAETGDGLDLAPMTDRNNDAPVVFDNLIVIYAEYIEYEPSLHDIVLGDAFGYQPALFLRNGGVTYGSWRAPDPYQLIRFEMPDGAPMPLKPGKTWIVIVGKRSFTTQPVGGEWEIYFDLP